MKETVLRFGENRSRKSGQGLGLYITRMLIERYGGRIQLTTGSGGARSAV